MNRHALIPVRSVHWVLAGLLLAMAPHATRFDWGLLAGFAALALWRLLGAHGWLPLPTAQHRVLWWLKQLLALAAFFAIYVAYRGQIGRDAGVALLTVLLGLKLLELDRPRDFYIVSFLAYFLVVTNFLYTQTVPNALYMLAVVVVITAGLVQFNVSSPTFGITACLRLAAALVGQAIPVMVIAFVLFPRLPGPLWGLPQDAFGATTGLSDSMTIGHITALGASDEIAFRVKFDGRAPASRDLYWRGPVLWDTDGRTWRVGAAGSAPSRSIDRQGPPVRYTVLLEPTEERWLLGLDAVTRIDTGMRLQADQMLVAPKAVKRRIRYTLESTTAYGLRDLTPAERRAALALPPARHPRTRALARGWQADNPAPAALVARALDFFRSAGFTYTLLPPALTRDAVDQFVFDTRSGFCEHFAASFVVLMRAAGVPARVVTGYQGGEFNDLSGYLVVRQRDAHAWAEVYLPQLGWTRVDPTGVVAPGRLSLGIESIADAGSQLAILGRNSTAVAAWRRVGALWDAASTQWAQWVLGYSPQRQQDLLAGLGFGALDYGALVLMLTAAIAVVMLVLGAVTLRARASRDRVRETYRLFCRKLARVGLRCAAHEGPLAFADRVSAARPDLARDVAEITRAYTLLRYADAALDPRSFTRRVRAFTPRPAPP